MTKGLVHSIESFGAVDGPGIRFLIFLKGCNMRCRYCHNADTWSTEGAEIFEADTLLNRAERYRAYWREKGGITVSGGEPLLQIDFLNELFKKAHERDINTALDTAAQPFTRDNPFFEKFQELMKYTDLVLLDIKHINSSKHKNLTGFDNKNILAAARYLCEIKKPVWIRYVLVPTVTDNDEDLRQTRKFLDSLENVQKVEVLPYHTLGAEKWKKLGFQYSLDGIEAPTKESIDHAKKILGDEIL